ncbi:alpha-hydroxy-acid oxidizing protein, partial [Castellaniella sp.]
DTLRALALGARGVLVGRAFLYALAAYGEAGVQRCLELMANELDVTMAFCGRTRVQDVDRRVLVNPETAC